MTFSMPQGSSSEPPAGSSEEQTEGPPPEQPGSVPPVNLPPPDSPPTPPVQAPPSQPQFVWGQLPPNTPPAASPPPKNNNMLWWVLGLGGGGCVVLTCITLVVSVGFLSLLGPQVTNAFTTNLGLQATSEAAQSPLTSGSGRASQVLTSSDGTIQIEVPSSWLTSNDLSTDAELQAAHLYDAQYVIVYRESKSLRVGLTLDDYTELVIRGFRQTNTETYVQSPKKTTVHGLPARRLELVGTRDGREGAYIVNVIEGENDFYRVFAYTRLERFERSRNVLEQIADSFRELR